MNETTKARKYIDTLNGKPRRYADALYTYYLRHNSAHPAPWPHDLERQVGEQTRARIGSRIRHYLVGDCDERGTAV